MGASAGLALILSLVRVKFAALLIGAAGVGLVATYNALLGAIVILIGMGVPAIAIREIAVSDADGQTERLASTVVAVKRLCWVLGVLGLMLTFVQSENISKWIFGDVSHAGEVAALSAVVFLNILNSAYIVIIQGTRQVSDLAKTNIWGAFGGTLVTLFCFIALGVEGVVWALLGVAISQFCAAVYFARRAPVEVVSQTWRQSAHMSWRLLTHGTPLMLSSFVATASSLIILAMITRDLSLAFAGVYSAAAALTGVFFGLLNSMGTDYYPRLSSASKDPLLMGRIVNEQTEIGLLLTVPGLLACWVLAPFLLELLYTRSFLSATPLLQWFLVGSLGRVISWPMGFVLLAMGRSKTFFLAELAVQTLHVTLVWFAIQSDSLLQTAIAFCVTYICYTLLMFFFCHRLIRFQWNTSVWRLIVASIFQFSSAGLFLVLFGDGYGLMASLFVVVLSSLISVKVFARIVGSNHPIVRKIMIVPFMSKWIKA